MSGLQPIKLEQNVKGGSKRRRTSASKRKKKENANVSVCKLRVCVFFFFFTNIYRYEVLFYASDSSSSKRSHVDPLFTNEEQKKC